LGKKYIPLTLKMTAERIRNEGIKDGWIPIRDFMDDFYQADNQTRRNMIEEEPDTTGDERFDAYLAALAELFAYTYSLPVPYWCSHPCRFLKQWWFPTSAQTLHAMALVESPAAFRRRGIFIDRTEFLRC